MVIGGLPRDGTSIDGVKQNLVDQTLRLTIGIAKRYRSTVMKDCNYSRLLNMTAPLEEESEGDCDE